MRCSILCSAFCVRLTIGLVCALLAAVLLITPAFAATGDVPCSDSDAHCGAKPDNSSTGGSNTPINTPMPVTDKAQQTNTDTSSSTSDSLPVGQPSPAAGNATPQPQPPNTGDQTVGQLSPAAGNATPQLQPPNTGDQTQPHYPQSPNPGGDSTKTIPPGDPKPETPAPGKKATTPPTPPIIITATETPSKAPATNEPDYQPPPKKDEQTNTKQEQPKTEQPLSKGIKEIIPNSENFRTLPLKLAPNPPANDSLPPQQNQPQAPSGSVAGLLAQPNSNDSQARLLSGGIGNLITAQPLSAVQQGVSPQVLDSILPLRSAAQNENDIGSLIVGALMGGLMVLAVAVGLGSLMRSKYRCTYSGCSYEGRSTS